MNNVSDFDAVRASRLIDGYLSARPPNRHLISRAMFMPMNYAKPKED